MPLLQKGVAAIEGRIPKVLSPKGHAIADYCTIATWGVLTGLLWGRNKRAAISALICGGAELGTLLMTDMPGGLKPLISYPNHLKIDFGLAATASAMPDFMGFEDEPESKWFRILGLNVTTVAALSYTDGRRRERRRRAA